MKKIMVFGAFDGLHPGHLYFFKQAKKFGDYLIVSVGTDKNVQKIKGKKPLFNEGERVELVRQLRIVDKAIIGAKNDFFGHIKEYSPDVICLGYDQWASESEVKKGLDEVGLGKVEVKRLSPYQEKRAKSTIIKLKSVDF